ncbi:MAG: hypothetical protein HC782_02315 [Gammaproteobacteria bacterium]|nr:hypothetical protein [Gammaproteobacteria bacterium]
MGSRVSLDGALGEIFNSNMANEEKETSEAIAESLEALEELVVLGGIFLLAILLVLTVSGYLVQRMLLTPIQDLHRAVHNAAVGGQIQRL